MRTDFLASVVAASLVAGCAVHPLPEDVTGVDTVDIVKQIRCETREALTTIIKEKLNDWAARGSPEAAALVERYNSDPDAISDFSPALFPGKYYEETRRFIDVFAESAIAYSFDLTMTEDNNLSASSTLQKNIVSPKFTLGLGAGVVASRSNRRVFTTSDTFAYLVTKLNRPNRYNQRYCDGKIVRANYVYPLAGRIGVDKSIRDFIELTVFGSLSGDKGQGPATITDNLAFTTTISASAAPKIEFTPVANALQVTSASLNAGADRIDTHKVAIGLALGPKGLKGLGLLRQFAFSPDRGPASARLSSSALYTGARVTGGGTPAEQMAVDAIDRVKRGEIQLIAPQ
jgi:hypothetical protein